MSDWTVWKSKPVDLWWANKKGCDYPDTSLCVCRSFNTWEDAMSYVKGYLGADL